MNADPSLQEALTRRQFLLQAAAMGGALTTPVSLFGQAVPVASGEAVETTELLHGWSLKSVEPQTGLTAEFLSQAGRAATADGWLPVAAMPAMVHDVLLAQGKIEEPWLPGGTAKCFWMGGRDWVYALRFARVRGGRAGCSFSGWRVGRRFISTASTLRRTRM